MNTDPNPDAPDWWTTNAPPPPSSGYPWDPNTDIFNGIDADPRQNQGGAAAPPGWHWDLTLKRLVQDTLQNSTDPGGTPPPGPNPGPSPGLGVPTTGFGAAPATYFSNPDAPQYSPLPTYVAPTWEGGDYVNPTEAELLASPGYGVRLNAGLLARNRAAAANGTVLNGGTLKALDRYGQDYATNEYQTLRGNTLEAYRQRYGQFTDKAGMDLNARTINANENMNTFQNRTQTYNQGNQRTLSDYITNVTSRRNSELDYWNRLQDLNQTGSSLAGGSR